MLTRSGWCRSSDLIRKGNGLQDLQAEVSSLREAAIRGVQGLGSTLMVAFGHIYSTFSASQLVRNNIVRHQIKKKKVTVEVKKGWFPPSC